MDNFKKMLKKLRTENDLYQSDLAQELGVSRSLIFSWEKGVCQPNIEMLFRICEIFDVDLNYLLGFEQKKFPTLTDQENKLLSLNKKLSEPLQHQLLGYANALADEAKRK